MTCVVSIVLAFEAMKLNTKLRIAALFFEYTNKNFADLTTVKTAIDQNDWSTAKELLEHNLRLRWRDV